MIYSENRCTLFRIMLPSVRAALAVALLQLVEELFEMRREPGLRPKALLKPFAHGIANRAAGAPVDLFAVIGERASHGEVPWLQSDDTVPSRWPQNGFAKRRAWLAFA
jgi:hypothetical protein